VLISLGIIAALATNVQARLGSMFRSVDANDAKSFISVGDSPGRSRMSARDNTYFQFNDYAPDSNHDCQSDSYFDD